MNSTTQLFRVTRAPEAGPMTEQQIQRMIETERTDSEWDVTEVALHDGRILPVQVAGRMPPSVSANCHATTDSVVIERQAQRIAELERMADADGQVIAGMRSKAGRLRDALVDLLDEYEDRKIQFGGDVLWAKHEDPNTLPKVCKVIRETGAKQEPSDD